MCKDEIIIIQGGIRSGKTTELVKLSSKNNIPIGVLLIENINLYKAIAKDLNLTIPEPILLQKNSFITKNKRDVLLDDIESFFGLKYYCNIKGFVIQNENVSNILVNRTRLKNE